MNLKLLKKIKKIKFNNIAKENFPIKDNKIGKKEKIKFI
jgi:hypothetical protein